MSNSDQLSSQTDEWDEMFSQRILAICDEWNAMSVDERFWRVFNWMKECKSDSQAASKRRLLLVKPYWQTVCEG
ncbi:MAG: hypothetical protein BGO59_34095 [Spirosoma sp. 48-14]|nr:MAG: hypothetical protein BGO59_34095 [Spirosoma sp. 48-14]